MDFFFSYTKKNGENLKDYFWGFWCGIMDIHNNKNVHDALKK
jgi:hypothetical protein